MNARSCQLCGKPLSRLRVGGDGDFCSKDHRNQFRLRAGMDRLVEVNKVASLMRRREAARQIPFSSLLRRGSTARHDFADLLPTNINSAPLIAEMRPAPVELPRIAATALPSLQGQPAASKGNPLAPRTHGREPVITPGNGAPPRFTERRHSMAVSFPRRESCSLRLRPPDTRGGSREFVKLPPPAVRTDFGQGPAMLRSVGRAWSGVASSASPITAQAVQGNALRVSIGVRFVVPKLAPPTSKLALVAESSLRPAVRAHKSNGLYRDYPATTISLDVSTREIPPVLPISPAGDRSRGFNICPAQSATSRMLRDMPLPEPRADSIPWKPGDPRLRSSSLSQTGSGFSRRNGSRPFTITLRPNSSNGAPQVVTKDFEPREELCVPKIPYCNVLAAAVTTENPPEPAAAPVAVSAPVLVPAPEAVRYEEHFADGWDNWIGGVADWKVDIAGVRTGTLALYVPTLELSDYDLEFLTRIDGHSVNWVVRAAGADSHYRCSVHAIERGQLEFSRAVVQGGVAEPAVVSSTRVPGRPRATFTVRMSAAGPIFSISIDGKPIDSWVDDRLATGGIGFMGAADDRARLYWVRVTSPSAPSKEHTVE